MPLILVVVSALLFLSAQALAKFDVEGLLGQKIASSTMSDFARQTGCVARGDYITHLKCLNKGVELSIDGQLNVNSVWLYAEGVNGYSAFRGQIPLGLAWGMKREQVEARLGTPQRVLGSTLQYTFRDRPFNSVDLDLTAGRLRQVLLTTNPLCPPAWFAC